MQAGSDEEADAGHGAVADLSGEQQQDTQDCIAARDARAPAELVSLQAMLQQLPQLANAIDDGTHSGRQDSAEWYNFLQGAMLVRITDGHDMSMQRRPFAFAPA